MRHRVSCLRDSRLISGCRISSAATAAWTRMRGCAGRFVRGEETTDPLDPEWMAIHQPHVQAASLERTEAGLERHRAYTRSTVEKPRS